MAVNDFCRRGDHQCGRRLGFHRFHRILLAGTTLWGGWSLSAEGAYLLAGGVGKRCFLAAGELLDLPMLGRSD